MRVPPMMEQIPERRRRDSGVYQIGVRQIRGDDSGDEEEAACGGARVRRDRQLRKSGAQEGVRDVFHRAKCEGARAPGGARALHFIGYLFRTRCVVSRKWLGFGLLALAGLMLYGFL